MTDVCFMHLDSVIRPDFPLGGGASLYSCSTQEKTAGNEVAVNNINCVMHIMVSCTWTPPKTKNVVNDRAARPCLRQHRIVFRFTWAVYCDSESHCDLGNRLG